MAAITTQQATFTCYKSMNKNCGSPGHPCMCVQNVVLCGMLRSLPTNGGVKVGT